MDFLAPTGTGLEGNTNSKPNVETDEKDVKKVRKWVFTYNNYDKNLAPNFISDLKILSEKFVIQEEDEGTPHLQGCIEWLNARHFSGLKKAFDITIHWEKCKKWDEAVTYCQDITKRKGRVWYHGKVKRVVKIYDIIADKGPLPWQKEVIDEVQQQPDDRTIVWYYDPEGKGGKTKLCKHLEIVYNAVYVSGKAADLKFAISKRVQQVGDVELVVFYYVRSNEEFVSYDGIESAKDGIFFSGKYESGSCVYNCPHLYVFANFLPDKNKLTKDRWVIRTLGLPPAPTMDGTATAHEL